MPVTPETVRPVIGTPVVGVPVGEPFCGFLLAWDIFGEFFLVMWRNRDIPRNPAQ